MGKVLLSHANAYNEILKHVSQDLRKQIEKGGLTHSMILEIARTVIIEKIDGQVLVSIDSKLIDRNTDVKSEQIGLIREIFSKRVENSVDIKQNVGGSSEKKIQLQETIKTESGTPEDSSNDIDKRQGSLVGIKRDDTKRKSQEDKDNKPKIETDNDFFHKDIGLPSSILGITGEYLFDIDQIIHLVKNKQEIPDWLTKNICVLDFSEQKLSYDIFSAIIEKFKNLKSLKLYEVDDKKWLERISKTCPNLTHLEFIFCNVSDISCLKNLTSLLHLDLGICKSNDISCLATLVNLKYLAVSSNRDFQSLKGLGSLKTLISLEYLSFSTYMGVGDMSVFTAFKNLKHLRLHNFGDDDLSFLKTLRYLEHLDLPLNHHLEDISFLKDLTSLTYLNLSECRKIRDISVVESLKSLKVLDLSYLIEVTDISCLEGLTSLTSLNLYDCHGVTDISCLKSHTKFEFLNLEGCNIVDKNNILEYLEDLDINKFIR